MPPHADEVPMPFEACVGHPEASVPLLPSEKFAPVPNGPQACLWPVGKEVLAGLGLMEGAEYSLAQVEDSRLRGLLFRKLLNVRRKDASFASVDSFTIESTHGVQDSDDEDEGEEGEKRTNRFKHTSMSLGKGVHAFKYKGETVWVVEQSLGEPVGTDCGAKVMRSTVLVVRGLGREQMLQELCEGLVGESEKHVENTYHMFQWHVERGYWRHSGLRTARPVESVVLPEEQKKRAVDDVEKFLSKGTRRYYAEHGIPYKRAYLFWGVPGTGKTSLIQALAGKYKRHLCFMQPTDPKFTDDMLKSAVAAAPQRSLIVFEDIDALFTKGRENRGKSAVTFSGLLNALDGVGMPEGQIFILTTNFREQLDAALIRNGRVDVHVEFQHISDEQCKEMFRRFFKKDAELADEFVERLHKEVGERTKELTPAILQFFFVQQRELTGREAIDNVVQISEELAKRDSAKEEDEKKEKDEKKDDDGDDDDKADADDKKASGKTAELLPTHHWHMSISPTVALTVLGCFCLPVLCGRHVMMSR